MEIEIDFDDIKDWGSFHKTFKNVMGFPEYYGANNNAWIDCMSYIDDKDAGMSEIFIEPGETLDIIVSNTEKGIKNSNEIIGGFIEIVANVNQRFIDNGNGTRVKIIAI